MLGPFLCVGVLGPEVGGPCSAYLSMADRHFVLLPDSTHPSFIPIITVQHAI